MSSPRIHEGKVELEEDVAFTVGHLHLPFRVRDQFVGFVAEYVAREANGFASGSLTIRQTRAVGVDGAATVDDVKKVPGQVLLHTIGGSTLVSLSSVPGFMSDNRRFKHMLMRCASSFDRSALMTRSLHDEAAGTVLKLERRPAQSTFSSYGFPNAPFAASFATELPSPVSARCMPMSKTPIKLKSPVKKPGPVPLAEQRRRFLEAARETGCGDDEPDFRAALRRATKLRAASPKPT